MLLAAMLATVLAAAALALARTANPVAGDVSGNVQYSAVCQNVFDEINAAGLQYGKVGDPEAGDDLAQASPRSRASRERL